MGLYYYFAMPCLAVFIHTNKRLYLVYIHIRIDSGCGAISKYTDGDRLSFDASLTCKSGLLTRQVYLCALLCRRYCSPIDEALVLPSSRRNAAR
jgi:hypothetical protein